VEGQGTIQDARREYATNFVAEMMGKPSILLVRLNFEPQANAGYRDLATIPGSSVRPSSPDSVKGTDAEVLAYMNAIDDTDIKAAATALKKNVRPEVKEYAKLIQKEHGDSKVKTMRLSTKIAVAPVETSPVGAMKSKNTDELAALVPLDGAQFEQGFAAEMVKNHQEALALIDNQLMNEAEDPQVRQNLAEARGHISYHLELAKKLQQP
jgi:predicted outer membrane protein